MSHGKTLRYLLTLWDQSLGCKTQTVVAVPPQQPMTALWTPTTGLHILSAKGRVTAWGPSLVWAYRGCLGARDLPGVDGVVQDLSSRGGVESVLHWRLDHSVGTGHL